MNSYELLFIIKPVESIVEETLAKVVNIITANKGHVEKTDKWGVKGLAYSLGDYEQGYYVLVTFNADYNCVSETNRKLINSDNVLRHMFVKKGC